MTPGRNHLVAIIQEKRAELVRESTDIVYITNETALARPDVEQMLHACVALVEEGLNGQSTEIRSGFLEALPDIARTTTWALTLQDGIPCWGVILGKLVSAADEQYRPEAITFLSSFMGAWWRDVSKAMLPVFISEGRL